MAVHEVSVFTSQLLTLAAMCKTHSIDNYYSCPSNLLINDFLDSIELNFKNKSTQKHSNHQLI